MHACMHAHRHKHVYPPLSDKPPTVSAEHLVTHTHKREHKMSVLFQLQWLPVRFRSLHDPVSYIQSTEWNSTTLSKQSDPKVYNSENAAI